MRKHVGGIEYSRCGWHYVNRSCLWRQITASSDCMHPPQTYFKISAVVVWPRNSLCLIQSLFLLSQTLLWRRRKLNLHPRKAFEVRASSLVFIATSEGGEGGKVFNKKFTFSRFYVAYFFCAHLPARRYTFSFASLGSLREVLKCLFILFISKLS